MAIRMRTRRTKGTQGVGSLAARWRCKALDKAAKYYQAYNKQLSHSPHRQIQPIVSSFYALYT